MRALTPAEVLFDGEAPPTVLPACDHYAGSEKLMLKSLALQQELGPVFDITLDCEDGAQVGREAEHAELVASLLGSEHDRFGRVGVRIHDFNHAHWRDDVRLILRAATRAPAFITLPKIRSVPDAAEMCTFIEATRRELSIGQPVPVQLLVETHGALTRAFDLAALPGVEALSFVSAHDGAIPDSAMRSPGQFDHPLVRRAKLEIAAACHAHGKVPSHNVSTEVRDMSVVANDATRARNEFGYTRMWSIHPAQVPAIVAAFAPREDEIVTATEILLAAQSAQGGPTRHHDTLHDRASYRYYWSVLRRARSTGRTVPAEAAPLFATTASTKESAS
jgi:citrate lyase subunit beta/citryl-CoA lyase